MQANVDSKVASARDYQDYVPTTKIVEEEECDTLFIHLPSFKKDELRVHLTQTPMLKISGERSIGDNKWSRFQKEYPVSKNCITNKITAKFDAGILCIWQPKLITPVVKKDEKKPKDEAQHIEKSKAEAPLPLNSKKKNTSKQRDETTKGYKREDEVALKSNKIDAGDVAQKPQEKKEQLEQGGIGNAEKGKRKMAYEFQRGDFVTGKVKMAKKVGTMLSIVVVVLTAIALGIYVKNLIMPANNYEN